MMFKFLRQLGHYFLMLQKVFSKPEKPEFYYKQTMGEIDKKREKEIRGPQFSRYNRYRFIFLWAL